MKKHLLICLVAFCFALGAQKANAGTYTWTGGSSGNWADYNNWSGPAFGYPGFYGTGDIALIGTNTTISITNGNFIQSVGTITVSNGFTVNINFIPFFGNPTLTVSSAINVGTSHPTTSQLNFIGTGAVAGASAISVYRGTTISSTATVSVTAGSMNLHGTGTFNGVLTLNGQLNVNASATAVLTTNASGNSITSGGVQVHSNNTLTWGGTGVTAVSAGSEIYTQNTNGSQATLTISANNTVNFTANLQVDSSNPYTAFFINNGTVKFTNCSLTTQDPSNTALTAITNNSTGLITLQGASSQISLAVRINLVNAGTIIANSCTNAIANGNPTGFINNSGTLTLNSATLTLSGGTGTFTNSGNFNLNTSSTFNTGNPTTFTTTSTGIMNSSASTINFGGGTNLSNAGDWNLNSSSTVNTGNTCHIANSGSIDLSASTFNFVGGADITNSGSGSVTAIAASNLNLTGNVSFINNTTSTSFLTLTGSTMTIGAGGYLTNAGTVTSSGNSSIKLTGNTSPITNSTGAIFNATSTAFSMVAGSSITNTGGTFNATNCTIAQTGNQSIILNQYSSVNAGTIGTMTFDNTQCTFDGTIVLTNYGTFTAKNGSTLNITTNSSSGTITNYGTFYAGLSGSSCIVTLNGNQPKIVNDVSGTLVGKFYVGSTSIIYPTSTTNGVVQNNNSGVSNVYCTFTFQSDALGSAAIGAIGSSTTFSGLFNVERFLTGGLISTNRGYRLLSSPVNETSASFSANNYVGLNYLNNHVYRNATYAGAFTGGPSGTTNGFSGTNTNATIYIYRENLNNSNVTFLSGKNVAVNKITTSNTTSASGTTTTLDVSSTQTGPSSGLSFPVANGFLMYFVGPSTRSNGSAGTAPDDATMTAGGYINQGTITVNLWYSPTGGASKLSNSAPSNPGYNMVGNPYASTINLATVLSDNNSSTGIDGISVLSVKNSPNQIYYTYTASGTSAPLATGGQGYAVSGEGFMVHAKSAAGTGGVLTFKETEKAPTIQLTGSALIMSAPEKPVLAANGFSSFKQKLPGTTTQATNEAFQAIQNSLTGFFMKMEKDTATFDYCGVYFGDNWTSKFQDGDALDLDGTGPRVYMSSFSSDGIRSAVKHFPDYRKGARIKLYADGKADGMYNLKIEEITNIDTNNYKINLIDHFKNDSLDIGRYKSYAFNILRSDTNTFGANRFELAIQAIPGPKYQLETFTAQKAADGVLLSWSTLNEGNNYSFGLEKQGADGVSYAPLYNTQSKGATNYKYTDKTPGKGNNVYRLKQVDLFGNITYAGPVNILYDQSGTENMFSLYPNPTVETINVNVTYGKTNNNAALSYKLNIYDVTGSVVMQKTADAGTFSQNVSQFKPGVYIVELKDNDGSSLGKAKFVKQ